MFERFTERARQVVVLAQEEARTLKHGSIGTEHLLLGLLRERDGLAAHVLGSFDLTLERARGEVVRIDGVGTDDGNEKIPFTGPAKDALDRALQESAPLGHAYIGTEHILLGLLAVGDGPSMRVLHDCHAEPERIRAAVLEIVARGPQPARPAASGAAEAPGTNGFDEWIRVGPGAGIRRLLMSAAARALDDGREDIQPQDVLLALTRDEHTGPVLADLGVDDAAILRAIERRRPADG